MQQYNSSAENKECDNKEAQKVEENYKLKYIERVEKLDQLIMKFRRMSYNTPEQRISFEFQQRNWIRLMSNLEQTVKKEMVQTIVSLILAYQQLKLEQWGHKSNLKNAIFMMMILQAQNTDMLYKNDLVLIKKHLSMMINLNLGWNSFQLQAFFSNYTETHADEVMEEI